MQFGRIDHVALDVADVQHSIDFYSKHFGFKHYFDQTTPAGLEIGHLKLGSDLCTPASRRGQCIEMQNTPSTAFQVSLAKITLIHPLAVHLFLTAIPVVKQELGCARAGGIQRHVGDNRSQR